MNSEKIKKIIREELEKQKLEEGRKENAVEEQLEVVESQLKSHANFLQEIAYFLTVEEDNPELAKELVAAHGEYISKIKEIMNSV